MTTFLRTLVCGALVAACGSSDAAFTSGTGGSGGATTTSTTSAGGGGAGATGGGGSGGSCPGTAPGCVDDWAGAFQQPGDQNGVGLAARFDGLSDLTGDGTYLYVTAHNAVRRIAIATATVEDWAGTSGQVAHLDATGTAARFDFVAGIATDGTTVWVADSGNHVIRAIEIATVDVSTLAGQVGVPGLQDGTGPGAQFSGIRGLAFDGTYLYASETTNHAIRRIDPVSGAVVSIAGGSATGAFADGPGATARFSSPRYLWAPQPDTIYVGDTENHRVRLVTETSPGSYTVSTPYGSGTPALTDGTGTAAAFNRLRGIAADGQDLLVADSDNFAVRHVDLGSDQVTTIAGTGAAGHVVGIGTAAAFDKPLAIYFEPGTGDLFISESNVIRRMYYH